MSRVTLLNPQPSLVLMLVMCLTGWASAAYAQQCTIRDLGPGVAFDINDRGEIVGSTSGAAYWASPSADPVTLATLPGWTGSWASAINDAGEIVGSAVIGGSTIQAVYWASPAAAPVMLAGGSRSTAAGINNRGQIVGDRGFFAAALFWPNAFSTPVALAGGSSATAINDNGEVVGFTGGFEGRFWPDPYGVPQPLATLPGGIVSYPLGINKWDQIAGLGHQVVNNTALQTAISWESPSAIPAPLVSPWLGLSAATAINDNGAIAGWEDNLGAIYSANRSSATVPLGKFASFGGAAAYGINNAGQVVGTSQTGTLASHAALWGPLPEGSHGCQVEVTVDIKPGDFPNTIKRDSGGLVPVAVFSTAEFDAGRLDLATVRLAGAAIARRPNGTLMASFDDIDGDGRPDLVLHVRTAQLRLSQTDTSAELTGWTVDGMYVRGSDSVLVR